MADSFSSPGIDLPSPTLSARLRELADFFAAPAAGRLTEEQRAMALGIARRLVADVAAELGHIIDTTALWRDWLAAGVPGAERITAACFARAEEHRWREHSAQRLAISTPLPSGRSEPSDGDAVPDAAPSETDRAYLDLQIADRRRFDAYGHPSLALADLDAELLRALLLDIAIWQQMQTGDDRAGAADLDDAMRVAIERHAGARGIDRAGRDWHLKLVANDMLTETAAAVIARHDWPALIALAAAANRRSYADTALALLAAEPAALPFLLAPLKLDRGALAPLEASLALLPARAVAGRGGHD